MAHIERQGEVVAKVHGNGTTMDHVSEAGTQTTAITHNKLARKPAAS
jgi:hypothetical protein